MPIVESVWSFHKPIGWIFHEKLEWLYTQGDLAGNFWSYHESNGRLWSESITMINPKMIKHSFSNTRMKKVTEPGSTTKMKELSIRTLMINGGSFDPIDFAEDCCPSSVRQTITFDIPLTAFQRR